MSKNTPSTPSPATAALIAELDRIRYAQGVTPYALAQKMGKSPNLGYKFFEVYRNPKVDTVAAVAEALGYKLALVPIAAKKSGKGTPTHLVTVVEAVEL